MMFSNVFRVLEVTSDHRVLKISSHHSGSLWGVVVIVRGPRWGGVLGAGHGLCLDLVTGYMGLFTL